MTAGARRENEQRNEKETHQIRRIEMEKIQAVYSGSCTIFATDAKS